MLGWNTGRFRTINKDQFATPTDRLLMGVKHPRIGRGSTPELDAPLTELIHVPVLAPSGRPSVAFATLIFLIGGVLGFSVVMWPFV